eukprot:s190_g8.t1
MAVVCTAAPSQCAPSAPSTAPRDLRVPRSMKQLRINVCYSLLTDFREQGGVVWGYPLTRALLHCQEGEIKRLMQLLGGLQQLKASETSGIEGGAVVEVLGFRRLTVSESDELAIVQLFLDHRLSWERARKHLRRPVTSSKRAAGSGVGGGGSE